MRYKNFIIIILILAASDIMAAPIFAAPCIWWRLDRQYRMADGRVNAALELMIPENMTAGSVEVYYRLISRERLRSTYSYSSVETAVYQTVLSASSAGKILFNISTGKNTCIELWARSVIGGQSYYAQTVFVIFGNGGNMMQNAQSVDTLPDWPRLEPVNINSFYRAQMERPLILRGMEAKAEPLHVLKNGKDLQSEIRPDADGIYSYTPPYDEYLAKTGSPHAKQDYVFAVQLPDGQGLLTLTAAVYRGYARRSSYTGGFIVLGSAFLISLTIIMVKRRRFPYQ